MIVWVLLLKLCESSVLQSYPADETKRQLAVNSALIPYPSPSASIPMRTVKSSHHRPYFSRGEFTRTFHAHSNSRLILANCLGICGWFKVVARYNQDPLILCVTTNNRGDKVAAFHFYVLEQYLCTHNRFLSNENEGSSHGSGTYSFPLSKIGRPDR